MAKSIIRPRQSGCRGSAFARLLGTLALAAALVTGLTTDPVSAAATPAPNHNPDKLYVDADQLTYDKDHNSVSAAGGVVLYYKGRTLQADKVVYDRAGKRVRAEGRVKLIDEHGDVTYAPRMDLSEDFASGFADSVQELAADRSRFSSTRIERSAGSVTVLSQGVYTACEPCKSHPETSPLWQVRAARIIENQQTHTMYFENAWLDVLGVPVAYIPYLSAADPTVTRLSGILAPSYTRSSSLGYGVAVPYFLALAPNYDLTLTPTYYTRQGPFADALWRHRFEDGEYSVRISGIDETNPGGFQPPPNGAGNLKFRYSVETEGKYLISDKWTAGWNLTFLSDRFYLNDYRLTTFDPNKYYNQDIVSQLYMRGQDGRAYFDLSAYRFQTTSAYLDQRQDPVAAPVFDYNRTFDVDPTKSHGLGGELNLDLNVANVSRQVALYQSTGAQQFDPAYHLYSTCAPYSPGSCMLRGMAGDYARATAQLSWQEKYVDPIGEVWTPFAFARLSGTGASLNTNSSVFYGGTDVANSSQGNFFSGNASGGSATAMPGVGLEYRYPFVSTSSFGQQTIEPIAQIIARPNEVLPTLHPNEDAQSLVFDDTNLFAWSKYSGYDRVEGGTRLNYGFQYSASFANGGHANVVGGQSIQLAGANSYTVADAANTGLESGLDKRYSNYVVGASLQPVAAPVTLSTKAQFNSSDYSLARFDGIISAKIGKDTSASLDYARYAPQPLLGWPYGREGLIASGKTKIVDMFTLDGSVVLDMSRHYYDLPGQQTSRIFTPNFNLGVGYDVANCTTFRVAYSNVMTDPIYSSLPATRDQTFLLQITLRTLGDFKTTLGNGS